MDTLMALLEGIDLQRTLDQMGEALRSPGEHRSMALVLVALIAVAVVLLILFMLMLVTPSKKKVVKVRTYTSGKPPEGTPPQPRPAKKPPGRLFLALTGPVTIAVLVVLAFVGLYVVTGTDSYCAKTCHAGSESIADMPEQSHADCVSCHESRAVLGAPVNVVSRLEMVWDAVRGVTPASSAKPVDSSACRRCHAEELEEAIAGPDGVTMSHAGLDAGAVPCTECHERSGHEATEQEVSMSSCVACHDSQTASADCATCHHEDPVAATFSDDGDGRVMGSGYQQYPAVRAANRNCSACHDMGGEGCDACHGIRMPHSQEFKEGGHARAAAFELKLGCWTCHDPVECGNCHGGFNPASGQSTHPGDWKSEHGGAGWKAGCGCHNGRSPRTYPICYRCHNEDHSLKAIQQ